MADSLTVLVVEDDPATQSVLSRIAQREGFAVIAAVDGAEALSVLAQRSVDGILLDLLLPKIDGFAIMRHLRETNLSLLQRTIVITAVGEAVTRTCEELAYVASFRRKPTGIMDIASDLRACLPRPRKTGGPTLQPAP